jgi:hypothetical protein
MGGAGSPNTLHVYGHLDYTLGEHHPFIFVKKKISNVFVDEDGDEIYLPLTSPEILNHEFQSSVPIPSTFSAALATSTTIIPTGDTTPPQSYSPMPSQRRAKLDDQRSYPCNLCPKSYRLPSRLRKHQKIHTRPFHCDHCDKQFGEFRSSNRHVVSKHPGKLTQPPTRFYCGNEGCQWSEDGTGWFWRADAARNHMKKSCRLPV